MLVLNIPMEGGGLYIDNGPIQMLIHAEKNASPMVAEAEKAGAQINNLLVQLVKQLSQAKRPWPELAGCGRFPGVLDRMLSAARATESPDMTPMCAVAGAFADAAADYLANRGATRVLINNGGDLALRLKGGAQAALGIADRVGGRPVLRVRLHGGMGVGGVATSGLKGRSFTLGVADAVTVFASTASVADACATHIANTTAIDVPAVSRRPARELDPDTDIPDLAVTTYVGALSAGEIARALDQAEQRTRYLAERGVILGAVLFVQGQSRILLPAGLAAEPIGK